MGNSCLRLLTAARKSGFEESVGRKGVPPTQSKTFIWSILSTSVKTYASWWHQHLPNSWVRHFKPGETGFTMYVRHREFTLG